jgi:hypothetical protein
MQRGARPSAHFEVQANQLLAGQTEQQTEQTAHFGSTDRVYNFLQSFAMA